MNTEMKLRKVERIVSPVDAKDGAGVRLKRVIGSHVVDNIDPFLLLDEFRSDNPDDYIAGFPFHPHRGIETVTYLLHGQMRHRDGLGNNGVIETGGAQWMTAGRGIMHEEIPEQKDGLLWGYQLWVNLPKKDKMTDPGYQDIVAKDIPEVLLPGGVKMRIVVGEVNGLHGPVTGGEVDPTYIDVTVPAGGSFERETKPGYTVIAYVITGRGVFGEDAAGNTVVIETSHLVHFSDGEQIRVKSDEKEPLRFLLISGKPLNEPIARYGPFVMNTEEEIRQTLAEIQAGTFGR